MTTQQMLDERYGRVRSPHARLRAWIIGVIVAVAAVAILSWMAFGSSANTVDAKATAYSVVDARTVSVSFQVTAPAGSDVACILEADDEEHGIVGWKVVQLPTSTSHTHSFQEDIPTVALATTGLVNTCWVP